ncbi:glycoside hydrolase family 3 protein [Actinomadura rupiterrae]|uniref:glycoside hydrolase family 3 protein n=1 Tax=Actinomadura rupiterrae TaxID=559627 RepID=UPI0027E2ABB9|nr:glycoside hydrolase family 3 N-terminal domain-containing protein [Actinomadura rupiterrae]MCP2335275.1 beta-N-acetylhexosaminidase [Actinomadura rupiterrae]
MAAFALAASLAGCGGGDARAGRRNAEPTQSSSGSSSARPDWVPGYVAKLSTPEKVGQLFVPTVGSASQGTEMIRKYHVGGVIYFPENLRSPRSTARLSNALQKASKIPMLIGVDEEQGIVSRTPFVTRFPGNMTLGASRRTEDARAAAQATGAELRAVGINQDYAPDADVNVNPANPVIGIRSFGADPGLVARMVRAAVSGYQQAGVAATAKHFPGHGDTDTDSHTGLPVIKHDRATWERLDAPPFETAGADAVMSAHIVVPKLDGSGDPATLSKNVLTGLLRKKLGFQGVIVTDSLQMDGVREKYSDRVVPVRAINAGADQLLMPPSLPVAYQAVLNAVNSGKIPASRLDDAVARILRLKQNRGLFRGTHVDPAKADAQVDTAQHHTLARSVAEHGVTVVRNVGDVLPLKGRTVYVTGAKSSQVGAALRAAGVKTTGTLGQADVALLTTLNSGASGTAAQTRSLASKPTVVAALGAPYDLDKADRAKALVATYSSTPPAITALARILSGQAKPTAKLPVPVAGQPLGTGLTY